MHTIIFTDEQMQVLNQALVRIPYYQAAPLINSINAQIRASFEKARDQQTTAAAVADQRAVE